MKAIVRDRYGPPDVLRVEDVPAPAPGPDEILIRVRAAEATKADCELRAFRFAVNWFYVPLRLATGIVRPRQRILGGYFAGEVAALGVNAAGFSVGDAVYGSAGLRMGGYGEFAVVPATATFAAMPRTMSFAEAAAVPLGGLNALHFLRLAGVRDGERVLINGAGGSIGAHGVQIAKALGAHVTGVDSARKESFVRKLGADTFLDYSVGHFSARGGPWDVIFDMVPATDYAACIGALTPTGRYVTGNPRLSVMLRAAVTSRFSARRARFTFARETKDELGALTDLIEAGRIAPIVDRVYPMADAPAAHRRVETEARIGAVVIAIAD